MYGSSNKSNVIKLVLAVIVIVSLGAYTTYMQGSRRAVSGFEEPVQTETEGGVDFTLKGYDVHVEYLYEYDMKGLVVHTRNYPGFGLGERLSGRDIGMAWGKVAALNDSIDFHWSQSGRWLRWNVDSYGELAKVGTEADVDRQTSNNHMVPADSSVRRAVNKIRRGDIVRIRGYLVNISARNSKGTTFSWNSSTSRTDSGGGACEVIYVTSVDWL